jgi:hypothetical protein
MKTEHTPGPWGNQGLCVFAGSNSPSGWKPVAEVAGDENNWSDPRPIANARLIAAAPELLAALKDASVELALSIAWADEPPPEMVAAAKRASAAIAAAEGAA